MRAVPASPAATSRHRLQPKPPPVSLARGEGEQLIWGEGQALPRTPGLPRRGRFPIDTSPFQPADRGRRPFRSGQHSRPAKRGQRVGLGAEASAARLPLVMLFGRRHPGQPHDGRAVGEAADRVRPPSHRLVHALQRGGAPDLAPVLGGKGEKVRSVGLGLVEQRREARVLRAKAGGDPPPLSVRRDRGGLGEDGADRGGDHPRTPFDTSARALHANWMTKPTPARSSRSSVTRGSRASRSSPRTTIGSSARVVVPVSRSSAPCRVAIAVTSGREVGGTRPTAMAVGRVRFRPVERGRSAGPADERHHVRLPRARAAAARRQPYAASFRAGSAAAAGGAGVWCGGNPAPATSSFVRRCHIARSDGRSAGQVIPSWLMMSWR